VFGGIGLLGCCKVVFFLVKASLSSIIIFVDALGVYFCAVRASNFRFHRHTRWHCEDREFGLYSVWGVGNFD